MSRAGSCSAMRNDVKSCLPPSCDRNTISIIISISQFFHGDRSGHEKICSRLSSVVIIRLSQRVTKWLEMFVAAAKRG